MKDRLAALHVIPPPVRGRWDGNRMHAVDRQIRRGDGVAVHLVLPLFWYEPHWIDLDPTLADWVAMTVANQDVVVSALARDLQQWNTSPPGLLSPFTGMPGSDGGFIEDRADQGDADEAKPCILPRMVPYRMERYGLSVIDFDDAKVIDVRLAPSRDGSGRMAYSPQQMKRWERPPEDAPIAGGGYVASATFPADVVNWKQMRIKLDQLRRLAPTAAVMVSIGPFHLEEELSAALVAEPDGLILRLDEVDLSGRQLAAQVHRAARLLEENGRASLPLWVVPGPVTPDDVVKLIALGASAVAIDCWCQRIVDEVIELMARGVRAGAQGLMQVDQTVSTGLWDDIDRVIGMLSSIPADATPGSSLGSFDPAWAEACGARRLT